MCIFCAAVPMAVSLGAAASVQQKQRIKDASARGEAPPKVRVPVGKITTVVIVGALAGSVVAHTTMGV